MAYKGFTISIAMATYNGELYIRQQLISILNQSVVPDQIVIADGGSTDKTIEICRSLSQEYSHVEFVIMTSQNRILVNENFNRAIEKCRGDYIFFSDQDDIWIREKIECVIDLMLVNDVVMTFTNAQIVDKELNAKGNISLWDFIGYYPENKIKIYKKGSYNFLNLLLQHNVVTGMTICFVARIRDVVIPFNNEGMYDKWTALIAIHFGNVLAVNKKLVLYRQHSNNQVGTTTSLKKKILSQKDYQERVSKKAYMMLRVLERIKNEVPERNEELIRSYCSYINVRKDYLEEKISLFTLVQNRGLYFKYEYLPYDIFLKDIVCKLIYKFTINR